jgi:hypothetical protein
MLLYYVREISAPSIFSMDGRRQPGSAIQKGTLYAGTEDEQQDAY